MAFKEMIESAGQSVKENSPTILTIGGVIGIGFTIVLACRATLKAQKVVEKHNKKREEFEKSDAGDPGSKEYTQALAKIYADTALKLAKTYAIPAVIGVASIVSILGGHKILSDRNVKLSNTVAALTTSYNELDKFIKQYRKRVIDDQGEEKDKEYAFGVKSDKVATVDDKGKKTNLAGNLHMADGVSEKDISDLEKTSPYVFVFDSRSPEYKNSPMSNMTFLQGQLNGWDIIYRSRQAESRADGKKHVILLNEVLDSLGLPRTVEGSVLGWDPTCNDGDGWLDFGINDFKFPQNKLFKNGYQTTCILEFNCDGVVYDREGAPLDLDYLTK